MRRDCLRFGYFNGMTHRIVIIGAGNWGTTLAIECSARFPVRLWTRHAAEAAELERCRENRRFLAGHPLPRGILVEQAFASELEPLDWIFLVVPSVAMPELCMSLQTRIHPGQVIINASKGVVRETLTTMSELVAQRLPSARVVSLTGPTIAREIANGEPARAVLSCLDVGTLLELKRELTLPHLSFEMSRDVEGAELCAALKGMVAILVGISDGLGYHANMQATIMTYGLREFRVISKFLGIHENTVYGLSGMGDLITTCISPESRNRRFGRLLAQGKTLEAALAEVGMVVEGVSMAKTIREMAHFNLDIPLFRCLAEILFGEVGDLRKRLLETLEGT